MTRLAVLLLAFAAAARALAAPPAATFLGDYQVTYYWLVVEDSRFARQERTAVLRDPDGRVLARVSPAFRAELDREGTGRLRDGRTLNVARRVDGAWRYRVLARGSWGEGAWGARLTPFHSVALDPSHLPAGTHLIIPALEGLVLPDGSAHDGTVVMDDVGSAIHGPRLDVFIARAELLALFERAIPSHQATPVFVADATCR